MGRMGGWIAVVLTTVLACAGILGWRRLFPPSPTDQLAAFVGASRWTPGRSTLQLPYRPYGGDARIESFDEAMSALFQPGMTGAPEHSLALAQFLLWRGETGDIGRALDVVEAESSAAGWNERALVLLAQGSEIEALDAIERALALDPSLPAALFNRALLLGRLLLEGESTKAWEAFLDREHEGPWADEARAHLRELGRGREAVANLDESSSALNRRILELKSAAELDALLAEPDTSRLLAELERLGDTLYHTEIAWLQQLGDRWPERVATAARYARERAALLEGKANLRVIDQLRTSDEPLIAVRSTHVAAFDAVVRVDVEAGRRYLGELERLCALHGCREETILVASDLGTLLMYQGDYQGAVAAFTRALEQMPEGYLGRRSELLTKLADVAIRVDAFDRAESLLLEAARLALRSGIGRGSSGAFSTHALLAQRKGMYGVAEAYARESRAIAVEEGDGFNIQTATTVLASALENAGRLEEAARLLEESAADAREAGRPKVMYDNALGLARIRLAQGRADDALRLATETAQGARELGYADAKRSALELEGRALLALGERRRATEALTRALEVAAREAAAAPSPLAGQSMAVQESGPRMLLARLRFEDGDVRGAWRALGSAMREPAPDECVIAPLADGSGTYFATATGTTYVSGAATSHVFGRDRCARGNRRVLLLDRPTTAPRKLSVALRNEFPELAIVQARDAASPWPDQPVHGPALVVHSPQPVVSDRPLPFLYGAKREAEFVLTKFDRFTELSAENATPRRVIESARNHGLIHFAVHGEARSGVGAASYLQLGGSAGKLQIADVLGMSLKEARPVLVLSACNTGDATTQGEHDGAGFPWAFLHAGARAVVAYQGALQDEVGVKFARAFYDDIAAGAGLSSAFERAVSTIRASHGAEAAAAFVLVI